MSEREKLVNALFADLFDTYGQHDSERTRRLAGTVADAALAHIAAVLRDEATVEAVARAMCGETWDGDKAVPVLADLYRRHALRALPVVADRLGASQPREVAPGGDASTTVDPDATTTEGDL